MFARIYNTVQPKGHQVRANRARQGTGFGIHRPGTQNQSEPLAAPMG